MHLNDQTEHTVRTTEGLVIRVLCAKLFHTFGISQKGNMEKNSWHLPYCFWYD